MVDRAERSFTQEDITRIADTFHAWRGTALGPAHTLKQSAFFRAGNVSKKVDGLYYVGGSTIPGIGLPMCLISAEILIKRLRGDTSTEPMAEPLVPSAVDAPVVVAINWAVFRNPCCLANDPGPSSGRDSSANRAATSAVRRKADTGNAAHLGAPMPGVISTVAVSAGQAVKAGDVLLSIEAMKMETALHAEKDGMISEVLVRAGDQIDAKDLLVVYGA